MIQIGSNGAIQLGWKAQAGANGPPVIGGGAIWSLALGSGELQALSPSTGAVLARIVVGPVPHFASPTLWDGLVLVGTMHGVTAIRARN
jgi:hypothetical protein